MSDLQEYKCPCCGGALAFNSEIQKMKCPYCDTEFEMETLLELDAQLNTEHPDDFHWEEQGGGEWQNGEEAELRSYVCNSCGGEIVGDLSMAATSCPWCGNPVVVMGQVSGQLKPDLVLPFKLSKDDAKNALERHISGKRLLPKIFKDKNHIDEIKGIYVPYWIYDATSNAEIRYKGTRTSTWSDSRYMYTKTDYYSVHRGGSLRFSGIPIDGSTKLADDLTESLEPYDMSEAVDFQTAYLAGFLADKYDVPEEECVARANERIKRSTEQAFLSTVSGYSSLATQASSVSLSDSSSKYALLPVWLLNTTYEGKRYTFAMNGQTGKMVGDLPCDNGAAFRWGLLIFGIVTAATYLLATLFSGLMM